MRPGRQRAVNPARFHEPPRSAAFHTLNIVRRRLSARQRRGDA
jgi:hypothetical protein